MSVLQKSMARLRMVSMVRLEYGLLAGIVLVAAVLRFYKLGEWSFWIDEIFTINRARSSLDLEFILKYWPPLSVILTGAVLQARGVSEYSARLVAVIVGILSVPILYFPTRKLLGPVVALVAALLLAVSPWHLYWSQNARFYVPLMLFYALAAFAFFFAIERDRPIYLVAFFGLMILAARERFLAAFLIPVVLGYLVLLKVLSFEAPPGLRRRNVLFLLVPGVAAVLFDLYRYVVTGDSFVVGSLDLTYSLPVEDPFRLAAYIGANIGIPLLSLALFAGLYLVLNKSRVGLFLLLGAVVPILMLLILNRFIFTKDRYALVTLPSWIMLSAVGVKELADQGQRQRRLLAAGVLAMLVLDSAQAALLYYRVNNGNRLDWRRAFAIARDHGREGDRYVAWWPEFGPYYLGQEVISWPDVTPALVRDSGSRYWFILDSETVWGNVRMKGWVEQNATLVEMLYLRTPDEAFLRVYLYDPP